VDKDINKEVTEVENQEKVQKNNPNDFHYFPPKNYARSKIDPMFSSTTKKATQLYTTTEIETMLKNPYSQYDKLQKASDYLLYNNSHYSNIVDYFANIMAFDYVVYPNSITEKKVTVNNRLRETAKIISKIGVKEMYPHILKQAILYGESYWYDLTDS